MAVLSELYSNAEELRNHTKNLCNSRSYVHYIHKCINEFPLIIIHETRV